MNEDEDLEALWDVNQAEGASASPAPDPYSVSKVSFSSTSHSPLLDDLNSGSSQSPQSHSHPSMTSKTPRSDRRESNLPYEDMTTIDWTDEYARDRAEHRQLITESGWQGQFYSFLAVSQSWIIVILSGILVGILAASIDIIAQWLGDLKMGRCNGRFYLSRDFCCWAVNKPDDTCPEWISWSKTILHYQTGHRGVGGWILAFVIYVIQSTLMASAAALLIVGLGASYAKMSGIAEIKTVLSGFVIRDFFSFKTLAVKAIGMCLVVGSGLWVGKEGPLVHIACCCASVVMTLISRGSYNEARKREILSAASAAGISVAFGAPIGGVLFTLEQLTYFSNEHIMWQSFVCAMVAAVTLQVINPFRTGKLVLFQVVYDRIWHRFELGGFAFVGIMGGLYGAGVIRLMSKFSNIRARHTWLKRHPIGEVALTATAIAILSYPNFYTRLENSVLLSYLFEECPADISGSGVLALLCDPNRWISNVLLLLFASVIGFVFTAYSFGLTVPAGILMPSMLVGALVGRVVGAIMQAWQVHYPSFFFFSSCPPEGICVTPGVYALVGAASALTGTTRLTASAVVIMFELTGALNYVLPIMVGVMISKWVADSFGRRGIYETIIANREYPYLEKMDSSIPIPEVSVSEVMTPISEIIPISLFETVGSLSVILRTSPFRGYPIVSGNDPSEYRLVGYISRRELEHALQSGKTAGDITDESPCIFNDAQSNTFTGQPVVDLRSWVDYNPTVLSVHATVLLVISTFQAMGYRKMIFTDKGHVRGIMTLKDVWKLLNSIDSGSSSLLFAMEDVTSATDLADDDSSRMGDDDALLIDSRNERGLNN